MSPPGEIPGFTSLHEIEIEDALPLTFSMRAGAVGVSAKATIISSDELL
jgi:hypothetical protein